MFGPEMIRISKKMKPIPIRFTSPFPVDEGSSGCSTEQRTHFKQNRKEVMEKHLIPQLKKSGDTLHGRHAVNKQYEHYLGKELAEQEQLTKPTYDYDVWSKEPEQRAKSLEQSIDKYYGCDFAFCEPAMVGIDPRTAHENREPKGAFSRWVVKTRATPQGQQEVDYTTYPNRPYKKKKIDGVNYEALDSAMMREEDMKMRPKRYFRSYDNLRKYQKFRSMIDEI